MRTQYLEYYKYLFALFMTFLNDHPSASWRVTQSTKGVSILSISYHLKALGNGLLIESLNVS